MHQIEHVYASIKQRRQLVAPELEPQPDVPDSGYALIVIPLNEEKGRFVPGQQWLQSSSHAP